MDAVLFPDRPYAGLISRQRKDSFSAGFPIDEPPQPGSLTERALILNPEERIRFVHTVIPGPERRPRIKTKRVNHWRDAGRD